MWAIFAAFLAFQTADFPADGLKALDEGHYEAAAQAFVKAVEADPKDYSAHFNLGLAYSFLGKDAEGVAEYRKALELKPGLYEAELNAAILLLRQKNPADALPLLSQASEQKPDEFRPRFYLAEAQLQTGAYDAAEAAYRRALELDPKSAPAELGLAHALARQSKLPEAAPHFRQAAQLDPKDREYLLELAGLYEKDRQPAEAIAIYREFPENAAAQRQMAQLMLESRQFTDALPQLEGAYKQSPTQANRVALAKAYVSARQLDKALPLLDQSVAAEPGNYDLRMLYGLTLRDRRQFEPAAVQLYEAAKLKPAESQTWSDLAGMLYMVAANAEQNLRAMAAKPDQERAAAVDVARRYQQSLAAFDRARDLGQNTAGNWYFRAIILDKLKQLKPALEAYQKFLSMSQGKNPDEEFKARQRVKIIQREVEKR
jgi:tetratricopeptide (TPR) repeat protein